MKTAQPQRHLRDELLRYHQVSVSYTMHTHQCDVCLLKTTIEIETNTTTITATLPSLWRGRVREKQSVCAKQRRTSELPLSVIGSRAHSFVRSLARYFFLILFYTPVSMWGL